MRVGRLSTRCHDRAHLRRMGLKLAGRRTVRRTRHYLSYPGPAYVRKYPMDVGVPAFIGGVRQKRFLRTTEILGRADTLPTIYNHMYPRRGRYRDGYVRLGVNGPTITVNCLRHFTTSCRQRDKGVSVPRMTRGGNVGVTIINSNPTNLSFTNSVTGHNCSIAIFRTLRRVNNILGCNVPRFHLPGGVISMRVRKLHGVNIGFVAGYVINGAVDCSSLRTSNFGKVFTTDNTKLPGFVGVPKRGLIKIVSSGRCLAHIGLVSTTGPSDSAPILRNGGITIVNNNGATVSSIHATHHLNTRHTVVICHHDRRRVPTHLRRIGRTGRRNIRFVALRGPIRCLNSRQNHIGRVHLRGVRLNRPSTSKHHHPMPIRKTVRAVSISRIVIDINISPGPLVPHTFRKLRMDGGKAVIIGRRGVHSTLPSMCTNNSVIHNNTAMVLTVNSNHGTTTTVSRTLEK